MDYLTLEGFNQSIQKLANLERPSEAEMISVSMEKVRWLLRTKPVLFAGNSRCTIEIRRGNTFTCKARFIGSGVGSADLLANQIERFLNNKGILYAEEVHNVFDFLVSAEVKLNYFE